jgi:preprotein translocase subunit SecE
LSEEKQVTSESAGAADSRSNEKKKVRKKNRLARWLREMRSELKKVVWPTPKQIINNTLVSLAVMVASAVVIWGIDQVGTQIFRMLITLGG